jgi:DNA gyrase subunit A
VIVRMKADAIPQQSRAATGVRLQKLDAGDRLTEVVLVPPAAEEEELADGAAEGAPSPEASGATAGEELTDADPTDADPTDAEPTDD